MVKITFKEDDPRSQLDPFRRKIFGQDFDVTWRCPQNLTSDIHFSPCAIFERMERSLEHKDGVEEGDLSPARVVPVPKKELVQTVGVSEETTKQEATEHVPPLKTEAQTTHEESDGVKVTENALREEPIKVDDNIAEEDEQNDTEEEEELDADSIIFKLVPIVKIKSSSNKVVPVYFLHFFKTSLEQANEMRSSRQTVDRALQLVVRHIPENQRTAHFKSTDLWQGIPTEMDRTFNTNLMNADSARMYELLAVVAEILFPKPRVNEAKSTYDVCVLCSPANGIVPGFKMFVDLTQPHLNLNLKAFTRHPWKELGELKNVISDDTALFWDRSTWRFVLNEEMSIDTKQEVIRIVDVIKTKFPNKLNLFMADLSCGRIQSSATDGQLAEQINKALLTEAGSIEVALRTIRTGGSFILSLANSTEPKLTIGNIRLLAGLFAHLWIVPTRPSSTWNRPIMLVCCGYVGVKKFSLHYPDFTENYFESIKNNLNEDKYVFMDLNMYPEELQRRMIVVNDFIAKETRIRTQTLITNFLEGYQEEGVKRHQRETADEWLDMITRYVHHVKNEWGVIQNVYQVTKEIEAVKQRWSAELSMSGDKLKTAMERLCITYTTEVRASTFLNVPSKKVKIDTSGGVEYEKMPQTIAFSRFASLDNLYDRMVVREIAKKCPKKSSLKLKPLQACNDHNHGRVIASLASDGFGFDTDEEHVVVACASLTPANLLMLSEMDIHNHVISTVVENLSSLQRDDNFYVCKYPMWTRLLIGIFCVLRTCFDEARLVVSNRVSGILFVNFNGQNETNVKAAFSNLRNIQQQLLEERPVNMEVVPITSIMTCVDLEGLVAYNDYLLRNEVSSMTKALQSIKK